MKKYILLFILALIFTISVNRVEAVTIANDSCLAGFNRTLRVGRVGDDVRCLQQGLKITADGKFGPQTKAAVVAWQARWGLVADGMFGAKSHASWVANGGNSGNFPEGCESASGYSRTTGLSCYSINSSSAPVITGVSGPQTLNINQEGTWKVTAYDKNGGTLSYSVVWGDEVSPTPMLSSSEGAKVQQTATFTHSYSQAGIYTPKFTVTNIDTNCLAMSAKGDPAMFYCPNTASASLSVNVGEIIIPNQAPTISSISPSSGVIGSQVTIYGSGFVKDSCAGKAVCTAEYQRLNTIKFGDSNSENDPNYNHIGANSIVCFRYPCPESITFTVPSSYYAACLHSNPACDMMTRMIQPGTYEVSVMNENGTSNAVKFTVTPSIYY
jgi:peptidoglycan hydrolase-like protein with peptidoglycan-binding domain